jgi:hypothetical protein
MSGSRWERPLRVVAAQPPLWKSSWRRWSASPPAAQESTEPAAAAAEEATAPEAQEEALAEAGLVDITSILSAPTGTVVRSSL